jgi:hypothetical protein
MEKNEMGLACSAYGGEVYTGFWCGQQTERFGRSILDKNIILRWIFRKLDAGVWTGLNWLRVGTDGVNM